VPAERGSAITLLYPAYTVVVPQPGAIRMPLTYPLAPDERWREFVNTRLRLKKGDGTIDRLYERWILGRSPRNRSQRWSVLHDVLGWVSPARCGCRQGPCAASGARRSCRAFVRDFAAAGQRSRKSTTPPRPSTNSTYRASLDYRQRFAGRDDRTDVAGTESCPRCRASGSRRRHIEVQELPVLRAAC
jgi:hypothetical protein